jgi:hypothetical protein
LDKNLRVFARESGVCNVLPIRMEGLDVLLLVTRWNGQLRCF